MDSPLAGTRHLPVLRRGGVPLLPSPGAAPAGRGVALPAAGTPGSGVMSTIKNTLEARAAALGYRPLSLTGHQP